MVKFAFFKKIKISKDFNEPIDRSSGWREWPNEFPHSHHWIARRLRFLESSRLGFANNEKHFRRSHLLDKGQSKT
jgi:chromosome condensin MukBEF complex kleisin-like MukF subunit